MSNEAEKYQVQTIENAATTKCKYAIAQPKSSRAAFTRIWVFKVNNVATARQVGSFAKLFRDANPH